MNSNKNTPKWAFDRLLQSFSKDNEKYSKSSENGDKSLHLPPCLRQIVDGRKNPAKKIPCLICGKLFELPTAFVEHSVDHLRDIQVIAEIIKAWSYRHSLFKRQR